MAPQPSRRKRNRNRKRNKATKLPLPARTTAAPQPHSRLLSLPPELRDQIYEYALTPPETGLFYFQADPPYGAPDFALGPHQQTPFNVLKYTSRQLRQETLGLEHKFNTLITFTGSAKLANGQLVPKCPASQFIYFTKNLCCEKARQTRLPRDIRVHYDLPLEWDEDFGDWYGGRHKAYPIKPLHEVARFCETHPTINVWWYTRVLEDILDGRERMFGDALMLVGTALGLQMRPHLNWRWDWDHLVYPELYYRVYCLWHDESKCPDPEDHNQCPCDMTVKAENFRLLPDVPKDRNWESEFREDMKWYGEEDTSKMIRRIKGFIKNGI